MTKKSYVQIKTEDGYKLVDKEHAYKYQSNKSASIMPDMQEMVSPIDGEVIGSRSKYREHMRKHGVIDVGNEKLKRKKREMKKDDSLKRQLHHLWENLPQHGPR